VRRRHEILAWRPVPGTVEDGVLRGETSKERVPNWISMDGQIGPNGKATLIVHRRTNDPKYVVGQSKPGSPYVSTVSAQFNGSTETGKRVELRPCTVNFVKR
jgi:hypothetical protein